MLRSSIFVCILVQNAVCSMFYADNGNSQTVPYEFTPRARRKFQNELLDLLDLDEVPRGSSPTVKNNPAPSYMYQLYKTIQQAEEFDEAESGKFGYSNSGQNGEDSVGPDDLFDFKQADTIMSFINQHEAGGLTNTSKRSDDGDGDNVVADEGDTRSAFTLSGLNDDEYLEHLRFDINDVKPEYELIGTELRVYHNGSSSSSTFTDNHGGPQDLLLPLPNLHIYAPRTLPNGDLQLHLIAATRLKRKASWLVLNVTNAFQYWIHNPQQRRGLLMEVLDSAGRRQVPAKFGLKNAFMVGFFNRGVPGVTSSSHVKRRQKRDTNNNGYSSRDDFNDHHIFRGMNWPTTVCQRRTLYVSFEDLNWKAWVIAPDGYSAYYCHGECSFPLTSSLNATNHAIVQTLVHIMNAEMAPKPCCAPTKLSRISVLFYDDTNNVILKKYEEMVVKSCGCH